MKNELVFEIPSWLLLGGWIVIKLIVASVLQRFVIANGRSSDLTLSQLGRRFVLNAMVYPEGALLWACLWPLFAAMTWNWNPKYALPGDVIDYLEQKT